MDTVLDHGWDLRSDKQPLVTGTVRRIGGARFSIRNDTRDDSPADMPCLAFHECFVRLPLEKVDLLLVGADMGAISS